MELLGTNSEWHKALRKGSFMVVVPKGTKFKDIHSDKIIFSGSTSSVTFNKASRAVASMGLNPKEYQIYQVVDGNAPSAFAYVYSIDGKSFSRYGTLEKEI